MAHYHRQNTPMPLKYLPQNQIVRIMLTIHEYSYSSFVVHVAHYLFAVIENKLNFRFSTKKKKKLKWG